MQIVAPTQITKNVPIKGSCRRSERNMWLVENSLQYKQ